MADVMISTSFGQDIFNEKANYVGIIMRCRASNVRTALFVPRQLFRLSPIYDLFV